MIVVWEFLPYQFLLLMVLFCAFFFNLIFFHFLQLWVMLEGNDDSIVEALFALPRIKNLSPPRASFLSLSSVSCDTCFLFLLHFISKFVDGAFNFSIYAW